MRLWYEGCELAFEEPLEEGELIELEIAGMGSIRAAVERRDGDFASVRFVEEYPV